MGSSSRFLCSGVVAALARPQKGARAAVAAVVLLTGVPGARAASLSLLPGFDGIDVYEATSGIRLWELNTPQLGRVANLGVGGYDFLGTITEFYDVFFSNSSGNYDPLGHFLTVECRFDDPRDGAGNVAQAELFWNDGISAHVEVANKVVHSVLLGTYKYPSFMPYAVDGNTNTATLLGNTIPAGPLLSVTLAFDASYASYVVPGTGSTAEAGGGTNDIGGLFAQFGNILNPGVLSAPYYDLTPAEISALMASNSVPFDALPQQGTDGVHLWDISFDGAFDTATFTVNYGDIDLSAGVSEEDLRMFHFHEGVWTAVSGVPDVANHTITFTVDSLSPFALGLIPEPGAWASAAALAAIAFLRRRRR